MILQGVKSNGDTENLSQRSFDKDKISYKEVKDSLLNNYVSQK